MAGKRKKNSSKARKRISKKRRTASYKRPKSLGLAPLRTGGFFPVAPGPRAPEKKSLDTVVNIGTLNSGTADATRLILVNGVAQGTDIDNRIGRQIMMKSLYIRLCAKFAAAATGQNSFLRMLLVYDCQTNAATPAYTDVLDNTSGGICTYQVKLANRDRFRILMDKVMPFAALGDVGGAGGNEIHPSIYYVKKFKKIMRETVFGTSNATEPNTFADINTGSLFLLFLTDVDSGKDLTLSGTARLRYTDE